MRDMPRRFCAALFMHGPVQMKLAAEAAHGARGEQGKINLSCSIDTDTQRKFYLLRSRECFAGGV